MKGADPERPAAHQEHPGEGDEEGGLAKKVDERAHARAERGADSERGGGGEDRMDVVFFHDRGDKDGGEADDRTDGEVNAAGENHQCHAHGGNAERGVVGEKVGGDAGGEKVVVA